MKFSLMKKRDKLLSKYTKHKKNNPELASNLFNEYKLIRNVTRLKRDSKYYKKLVRILKINCQHH